MPSYIVCQKKRNNPRMDIRICQKKCDLKDDCEEFISINKVVAQDNSVLLSAESQPVQMELALNTAT